MYLVQPTLGTEQPVLSAEKKRGGKSIGRHTSSAEAGNKGHKKSKPPPSKVSLSHTVLFVVVFPGLKAPCVLLPFELNCLVPSFSRSYSNVLFSCSYNSSSSSSSSSFSLSSCCFFLLLLGFLLCLLKALPSLSSFPFNFALPLW